VLEGNNAVQAVYKSFGFSGYELDPKMGKEAVKKIKIV